MGAHRTKMGEVKLSTEKAENDNREIPSPEHKAWFELFAAVFYDMPSGCHILSEDLCWSLDEELHSSLENEPYE